MAYMNMKFKSIFIIKIENNFLLFLFKWFFMLFLKPQNADIFSAGEKIQFIWICSFYLFWLGHKMDDMKALK